MITNDNKNLVQWAMDFALKNGCQASKVSLYNGSTTSFEIRDRKIDRLHQASENSLVVQLYVDGRFGSFSTNRLDKSELEKFIRDNIDATRYLAEDKARTLPDASRYYKGGLPDLQLIDPDFDTVQPDVKKDLALQACEEIMGKDERIISASAAYGDEKDFKYMVTSNGFEGETSASSFSLAASVSIKGEGEARPESYWYDSSLYFSDLQKTGIGTKALERVLRKLGQKKIQSGRYDMVVDNMNAARLLSPIMDAIDGAAIQQKSSFLMDKLGEQVVGKKFTLRDEPHLRKAAGARYFDNEGVATRPLSIFKEGVLETYFIDTYRANKMQVAPTISSPSILTMEMGNKNLEGLIAGVGRGILVTGFNGGNCNSTSGDFSYGIEGFFIENGKLARPISEMNVTGNMLQLWNHLVEAGNDPRLTSSWQIPSLLFEGIDFSGL